MTGNLLLYYSFQKRLLIIILVFSSAVFLFLPLVLPGHFWKMEIINGQKTPPFQGGVQKLQLC